MKKHPGTESRGIWRSLWLVAGVALLHGCSTPPAADSAKATPDSAPPAASQPPGTKAPRTASITVERRWLQSWFEGTPVRIEQRSESEFDVDVPREFCFDEGRSAVKPPLAAVLDKVAQSLQRKPGARVVLLAAPGDAPAATSLALLRAEQVRKHLLSRGVSAQQLGAPTATTVAAVQLRIGIAAP